MTSKKDDIAKMLHDIRKDDLRFENLNFEIFSHDIKNIEHCVVKSAKNFAKSFFSDSRNFGVKGIKSIFTNKGNSETWLEHLLLPQAVLISIKLMSSCIFFLIFLSSLCGKCKIGLT